MIRWRFCMGCHASGYLSACFGTITTRSTGLTGMFQVGLGRPGIIEGSVAEGQGRDSLRSIDLYTLPGGYNCVVSPQPYHISWQLSPDHRDIFAHAYCFDVRYSLRDRPESHPLSDIPELVVLAKDGATDRFGAQLLTREEIVRLKHGDPYHEIWQQPHCRPTLLKAAELDGQTRQCVVVLVSSSINHRQAYSRPAR